MVDGLRRVGVVLSLVAVAVVMFGIAPSCSRATAAQSGGVELIPVGGTRTVGPLRIKVASATSTVQPHTYRLTMTVDNQTNRTVHGPHVDLNCKGDSAPRSFGLSGFLVPTASKLQARSKGHGVLVLDPQGVCESPSVRFSTRQKQPGGVIRTDEVTYSLAGLS